MYLNGKPIKNNNNNNDKFYKIKFILKKFPCITYPSDAVCHFLNTLHTSASNNERHKIDYRAHQR